MKKLSILSALALFAAQILLAEPTHTFKFTGFGSCTGQTVCQCSKIDVSETLTDDQIKQMIKDTFDEVFMSEKYWKAFGVSSWSELYSFIEKNFPSSDCLVTVPASGEFLFDSDTKTDPTKPYIFCGLVLCPEGLKPGKPYTLYATPQQLPLETPGEHLLPAVPFDNLLQIESGKFMSDAVPEPALALAALAGLLAFCRRK